MRGGLYLSASYVGRFARDLLSSRDVMALLNIKDTKSGMDWYTAATQLEKLRQLGTPVSQVQQIPYFANLFPANLASQINGVAGSRLSTGYNQTQAIYAMTVPTALGGDTANLDLDNDWTTLQDIIDDLSVLGPHMFYNPQYGALSAVGNVAWSNYNGLLFTARERFRGVTVDFNYTYSHALDNSSGLQAGGLFGTQFIVNAFRPQDWYANSDFDSRHQVNINSVVEMPFGRGQHFGRDMNRVVDFFVGGWRLSNIFRWNTGLPVTQYGTSGVFDDARWATNWNVQSNATPVRAVPVNCANRPVVGTPALFGDCKLTVYNSFRNAYPGESGPRNIFRTPGYVDVDAGLAKQFHVPGTEKHLVEFRWETFNVTNTQRFGGFSTSRTGFGVLNNPGSVTASQISPNWSAFNKIQGTPRVMQFALRYSF